MTKRNIFPPVLSNSALTILPTKDGITEKKNLSYFQTSCIIGLCGRTWIFQLDEDNRVCRTPDWFKIFGFSLIFVSLPTWEKAERKSESK